MDFSNCFQNALDYTAFLDRHGTASQRQRWHDVYQQVKLTTAQQQLLAGFRRQMKVLCLAGVWCGDCAEQCPIFVRFAECSSQIQLRFIDRDADASLSRELSVCGGARVPVVVFLSEDEQPLGRYGDRTLAKYRSLAQALDGAACSTGFVVDTELLSAVTQEWLDQFERNQLILRTSPRLRAKHGD